MNPFIDYNKSFIDGQWVDGEEERVVEIVNPYDNEILTEVKLASLRQLDQAFQGAKKAQKAWGNDPELRRRVMERVLENFKENKEDILDILVLESGSTLAKVHVEFDLTLGALEAALTMVDKVGKFAEKPSLVPGKVNEFYRLPKGVIASIAPFNFPLYLSMRTIAPALALGNAVVHKPDLQCGISSGSVIALMFSQAGIPDGVFQCLLTKSSVIGDAMFEHDAVDLVSFTGSTPIGRHIGSVAGSHIKDVALELGGNAPFCVLSDADVDQTVNAAIFGKYFHQGQICMMVNRFIVHENIYEEFVEKFVERSKRLKYGDPRDPEVVIGPLINESQVQKALSYIDMAKKAGYDILLEGKRIGNILTPTVIGNVDNKGELAQTELFAPIALIIKGSSDDEIIEMANDTIYGLSSAIFSRDVERARKYALELKFGMTHINDQTVNDEPSALFGGMRQSGIGRFGDPFVIDEFTEGKWITVQKEPREFPF